MAQWRKGDVTLRAERSEKEDALHIGAETPYGSGFASLRTGWRELLRCAGMIAFALYGLRRGAKQRQRQRQIRAASRGGGFHGAGKKRR